MKKVIFLTVVVAMVSVIYSCTPELLNDGVQEQSCCGEGENIPPPPPPPPPGTGG